MAVVKPIIQVTEENPELVLAGATVARGYETYEGINAIIEHQKQVEEENRRREENQRKAQQDILAHPDYYNSSSRGTYISTPGDIKASIAAVQQQRNSSSQGTFILNPTPTTSTSASGGDTKGFNPPSISTTDEDVLAREIAFRDELQRQLDETFGRVGYEAQNQFLEEQIDYLNGVIEWFRQKIRSQNAGVPDALDQVITQINEDKKNQLQNQIQLGIRAAEQGEILPLTEVSSSIVQITSDNNLSGEGYEPQEVAGPVGGGSTASLRNRLIQYPDYIWTPGVIGNPLLEPPKDLLSNTTTPTPPVLVPPVTCFASNVPGAPPVCVPNNTTNPLPPTPPVPPPAPPVITPDFSPPQPPDVPMDTSEEPAIEYKYIPRTISVTPALLIGFTLGTVSAFGAHWLVKKK